MGECLAGLSTRKPERCSVSHCPCITNLPSDRAKPGFRLLSFLHFAIVHSSIGIVFGSLWYALNEKEHSRYFWSLNAVGEYVMSISMGLFFLTFAPEFKRLSIELSTQYVDDEERRVLIDRE